MDDFQELLLSFFPDIGRIALDAGITSWARVREAVIHTGLSEERVITTKCRLIADILAYLLSYQPYEGENTGWWIRIRGVNHFNQPAGIGHAFIVIERNGRDKESREYLLVDGYIGCREITYRSINFIQLLDQLDKLQERYDPDLWEEVTGCREDGEDDEVDHCEIHIKEYSYSDDHDDIMTRYQELVDKTPNLDYGHRR